MLIKGTLLCLHGNMHDLIYLVSKELSKESNPNTSVSISALGRYSQSMAETRYFNHTLTLSPHSNPPNTPIPLTLAYSTHGSPSLAPYSAVLLPSCYGGKLDTTLPFLHSPPPASQITPCFPPSDHFIITTALLGNAESSSPSNTAAPPNGPSFSQTTYEDNIRLQHALCQSLGVKKLYAYVGFSMGGQQAYHMAALLPDFVENVVCLAGSARTSWHNWSFLEGPKAALVASEDFHDGKYQTPARKGTGAFGRVYSTWALSQEWFRQRCWEQLGCASLPEYLERNWEKGGVGVWDANDLLCLLRTWQMGDIGLYYPADGGDLRKTLGKIEARVLVMPSRTDMYFPPEDSAEEVKYLKRGELRVIESIWGHVAGGGGGTMVSLPVSHCH